MFASGAARAGERRALLSLAAGYAGPPSTARGAPGPAGRRCSLEECLALSGARGRG